MCKALYATRTWGESLPLEDKKLAGWEVFYILEDVVSYLRTQGEDVVVSLAE